MVVNNNPASADAPNYEREITTGILTTGKMQSPAAQHERGVVAQWPNFQLAERQAAHLLAIRVFGLVSIQRGLPAACGLAGGAECQLVGLPVAIHECVDVAAVPGGDLGVERGMHADAG